MSKRTGYVAAAAVTAVVLLAVLPIWTAVLLIVGLPVGGYLLLDRSQRKRLRRLVGKERRALRR